VKLLIGLTGGIGSGKSTVGRLFEGHGIAVIDADAIARAITASGGSAIEAIRDAFGADYIDAAGALDRAKMRALAFSDRSAKQRLEAILHPMIRVENDRQVESAQSPYVILMIPLLVESGDPRRRCRYVIVVDCDEHVQLKRVIQRDRLAPEQVRAIIGAQVSRAARLAHADDVVDNVGPPAALASQVASLDRKYRALAAAV
jgi:dephospho-CoA kinase